MDEYLIHTAQSYADAPALWGYFEFRYGDDDHWQNVDTGKVLAVMGVKNFQGMDIDPNPANEHIMDAFREANTAQINYAK